ncbi:HNH endonuclease [Brevibacillus laterosporus]|uniref:HNH endonuclease n=1 Tax=Brevibacillus laterosporus TaxID=1465 RepID=A0A518VFL0_BRELA|nr:HNH endonuclease [Brevibacillus laterosporus]
MSTEELAKTLGYKNASSLRTVASRLGIKKSYKIEDISGENWLEHPDYPDFLVSNKGRIKSRTRNTLIFTRVHEGYYDCRIKDKSGKKKSPRIHRLVAEVFVPNPKGLPFVNHVDGNKLNNDATNLEWVTRSENSRHAREMGLVGVRRDTLDEDSVRDICKKLQAGASIREITHSNARYTRARVEGIRQRRRWLRISGDYSW